MLEPTNFKGAEFGACVVVSYSSVSMDDKLARRLGLPVARSEKDRAGPARGSGSIERAHVVRGPARKKEQSTAFHKGSMPTAFVKAVGLLPS